MAGRQTLTLSIEVRILVPQPIVHPADFQPLDFKYNGPGSILSRSREFCHGKFTNR